MDFATTIHTSAAKTMAIASSPSVSAVTSAAARSPWHSPVPYLFGGLAAMLGLIAFALLILACSYWRLSGYLEGGSGNERDLEAGEGNGNGSAAADDGGDLKKITNKVFEEKFLVIMPGQEKPTCLATPTSSRASSFGSNTSSCKTDTSDEKKEEESIENNNNLRQVEMGSMDGHQDAETGKRLMHHQLLQQMAAAMRHDEFRVVKGSLENGKNAAERRYEFGSILPQEWELIHCS